MSMEMPMSEESKLEMSKKNYKDAFLAYRKSVTEHSEARERGEKWQETWSEEEKKLDQAKEDAEKQLRFDGGSPGEILKAIENEDLDKMQERNKQAREWYGNAPSR